MPTGIIFFAVYTNENYFSKSFFTSKIPFNVFPLNGGWMDMRRSGRMGNTCCFCRQKLGNDIERTRKNIMEIFWTSEHDIWQSLRAAWPAGKYEMVRVRSNVHFRTYSMQRLFAHWKIWKRENEKFAIGPKLARRKCETKDEAKKINMVCVCV